jgi:hypothetical protein
MAIHGYSKRRLQMGEAEWKEYQKNRRVQKVVRYRQRVKLRLIEHKGGKCLLCGYEKPIPGAYAFHHRDPDEKDFEISHGYHMGFKRMQREADKCDLLCVRCHEEEHYKMRCG